MVTTALNVNVHSMCCWQGKLFMAFNEVRVSQDKASVWETLKSLIPDAWQQIEYKGGAIVQREMMFNVRHEPHRCAAQDEGCSRICPLFCAQQSEDELVRDGMRGERVGSRGGVVV